MTLDARRLARVLAERGPVARVVVAGTRGSAPREAGAEMLVWGDGQAGTIGGGALEWEAARGARAMLAGRARDTLRDLSGGPTEALAADGAGTSPRTRPDAPAPHDDPDGAPARSRGGVGEAACRDRPKGRPRRVAPKLERHALGPALGQCCGGAVSLVTEVIGAVPPDGWRALRVGASAADSPPPGLGGSTRIERGWLVEPVIRTAEPLWIWGAGHVGRALVSTLTPLARFDPTWVDVAADRFPEGAPGRVVAADPPAVVPRAPREARHLVLTHSHAIDLALCHALLTHGFRSCGLIGSATKWARFRSRLRALGHAEAAIDRIECPIGEPALGKHPQAIAIGVAAALLREGRAAAEAAA